MVPWKGSVCVPTVWILDGLPLLPFGFKKAFSQWVAKLGMFADKTPLVSAKNSRCYACTISGNWWHLVLGMQNWPGKTYSGCISKGLGEGCADSHSKREKQSLSWGASRVGTSGLLKMIDVTKAGLWPPGFKSKRRLHRAEKVQTFARNLSIIWEETKNQGKKFLIMQCKNSMHV